MAAKISVVIRTRDKEKYFRHLLENLCKQTVEPSELVIVNNYSSENKKILFKNELVKAGGAHEGRWENKLKLFSLADSEFSHAYSTNVGVAIAENEMVCITNFHSLPVSLNWLQNGLKHFEDRRVAGVSGFFLPHQDGTMIGDFDRKLYQFTQKAILRQDWCSTINCIIRKSLWNIYPFDENLMKIIPETREYGLEDYDWSKEMTFRGNRIVIDPAFSVFHSHGNALNETARNVKGYFIYRKIQQKIDLLRRPRKAFSRVFEPETSATLLESIVRL